MKPTLRLAVYLCATLVVLEAASAAPTLRLPAGYTPARSELIPARPLRGYGQLSGDFVSFSTPTGGSCSLLTIHCADVAHAKIVHAKYLSDLHLVLSVSDGTVPVGALTVPAVTVPDQGLIAAFRAGATVYVAAATDQPALTALLSAAPLAGAELTPSGSVPLYLDSWDQHGWSFYYYNIGNVPTPEPGQKRIEYTDYHVLGEFDWAKQFGDGMVFWQNEDKVDTAEGLDNNHIWSAFDAACAHRGLPVILNTTFADGTWLVNRYRDDTEWGMPGYIGGFHTMADAGDGAGLGHLAWSADAGLDAVLGVMQRTWHEYAQHPEVTEYMEPHCELRHGAHDIFNEYGPSDDKSFRTYLKEKYATPAAVGERWYGQSDWVHTWDDVHVPTIAHFFGYTKSAFDLAGDWKIKYEDFGDGKGLSATPAPADWYLPATSDADWPTVSAPDSQIADFLPRRPALWRRHFTIPAEWRADKPKVWLYVFSLNRGQRGDPAPVYLNGKQIAKPEMGNDPGWFVVDVTTTLQDGDNLLALRLPNNYLGYRAYLTAEPPATYPYLGPQLNAQWVDFIRWLNWVHGWSMRRCTEAIREQDPDRSIIFASPDSFITEAEQLCQDYGGHFHNTGYMGGWWAEPLPMMMRAADQPFSAEPGNPAHNLTELKNGLGNWLTEGVNSIHYFIHVGDIYWDPIQRPWFEQHQAIIGAFGKMHIPKAQAAMLYGDDVNNLQGWPMGGEGSGYVPCQFNVDLHKDYHMDGVSLQDFRRGYADDPRVFADAYRAIVDTNTDIMDPSAVTDIEAWIKRGGVFICMGDTGRHTPEQPDTWPISRLTGYHVTKITGHPNWADLTFAPGQPVFDPAAWDPPALHSVGQYMEPVAADCVPLALWPDGHVAIGMRKIGAGTIIDVGCDWRKPQLLRQIFAWLKLTQIPGYCDLKQVISTHELSNNGLYEIWITWNPQQQANTTNLIFRDGVQPPYLVDLQTQEKLTPTVAGGAAQLSNLSYDPEDIRIFAAPRRQIATAPLDWFNLQRGWWRGTTPPSRHVAPYQARFALNLDEGWRRKPLDDQDAADHSALAAPALDDRAWPAASFAPWLVPEDLPTHRAFFRKQFTVPAQWGHGEVDLWMESWLHEALYGTVRVWLDGAELLPSARMIQGQDLTAQLKPGTSHLLAIEVRSQGEIAGPYGDLWIDYLPPPAGKLDLAGPWSPSPDALIWQDPVALPGPLGKATMVRRTVHVDGPAGRTVMLFTQTNDRCTNIGALVNGHWVRRHHHVFGSRTSLNITPWIKFGQDNELILPVNNAGQGAFTQLELRFFPAGSYP